MVITICIFEPLKHQQYSPIIYCLNVCEICFLYCINLYNSRHKKNPIMRYRVFFICLSKGYYIFNEKNIQILNLLMAHINTTNLLLYLKQTNKKKYKSHRGKESNFILCFRRLLPLTTHP
jgi:hypothetical protein